MLKPLTLKETHTYKYLKLDEEGLGEIYDMSIIRTQASSKQNFINYHRNNPGSPIKICLSGDIYGVFFNNYLVLQYTLLGTFNGLIAFENEEQMLQLFDKVEG